MENSNNNTVVSVKNLQVSFRFQNQYYNAVDNVSLDLKQNEIYAIVGESGCGKSTLATAIMRLHNENYTKIAADKLKFYGVHRNFDILHSSEDDLNTLRGSGISMIFQDPLSALNPLMRVENQIAEMITTHKPSLSSGQVHNQVLELLDLVGIPNPKRIAKQYPHQLSGGMKQRVIIAIACALKPNLIIADEPTTALDVTIQAQILDLIKNIQKEMHSAILFITHDLGVVAEVTDKVAVMYAGQFVETGTTEQIFKNPTHPYTRSLLKSTPQENYAPGAKKQDLYVIQGVVPSLRNMPKTGCRFAPRIPWIEASKHEETPHLHNIGNDHLVRCSCYKYFTFKDISYSDEEVLN